MHDAWKQHTALLRTSGIAISMASIGELRENCYAERVIRTIKEEHVDRTAYEDDQDARRLIGRFLDDVYNRRRLHSALGYRPPDEFECLRIAEHRR